jgi:MOSC domain-containing protein YiiM
METVLEQVFAGSIKPLGPDGTPSGIYKEPLTGPMHVGPEGLVEDRQADRRFHGGPEKALHQYPADNYAMLQEAFPEHADALVPGVLGENFSTTGMTEHDVAIGDTFSAGEAVIQVTQPRRPCWKINQRLDLPELSKFIHEACRTGWYYRVLQEGSVGPGDVIRRIARPATVVSVARFWELNLPHRPNAEDLSMLLSIQELSSNWRARLEKRIAWLAEKA